MSHVELQPGFDFQQAGKEVLAIERECLAELDQYINQNFTLACGNVCQHRYTFIFRPSW